MKRGDKLDTRYGMAVEIAKKRLLVEPVIVYR
jgi:hypothetical protein